MSLASLASTVMKKYKNRRQENCNFIGLIDLLRYAFFKNGLCANIQDRMNILHINKSMTVDSIQFKAAKKQIQFQFLSILYRHAMSN